MQRSDLERLCDARITCGEALRIGEAYLQGCGICDAAADAWLLFEFVTGMSRAHFLAERGALLEQAAHREAIKNGGCDLPPNAGEGALPEQAAAARYRDLLLQRGAHIPVQHLTGEQEFMGFPFYVNGHVLIPRQDTEILVEEALKCLRAGDSRSPIAKRFEMAAALCRRTQVRGRYFRVLDLCTGSGCIAVSLAKLGPDGAESQRASHFPEEAGGGVQVDASDISEAALAVARRNVKRNHAAVRLIRSDLFEAVSGPYDMIVSNPPYIRTEVIAELDEEVRLHEPQLALDGHEDGLYFYRRIAGESGAYLKDGGFLLLEIGYDQSEAVEALLREAGFEEIRTVKDLAGLDRVVCARKPCV